MSLYPSALFHFTSKKALFGILASWFRVSYAREKLIGPQGHMEFAVPIVSFCDLRLSELKSFLGKYGNYGIGMTKEWAYANGLNPVWYVSRHSEVMPQLVNSLKAGRDEVFAGGLTQFFPEPEVGDKHMWPHSYEVKMLGQRGVRNIYRYVKNYRGELIRKGKCLDPNYPFADEREWRFAPHVDCSPVGFLPVELLNSVKRKQEANKRLEKVQLNFTPDDIKYLVVEKDGDILELVNHLTQVKAKYSLASVSRLTTRILTAEQIHADV